VKSETKRRSREKGSTRGEVLDEHRVERGFGEAADKHVLVVIERQRMIDVASEVDSNHNIGPFNSLRVSVENLA
jgi:hypothetical protein